MKKIALILSVTFLMFSCSKDDDVVSSDSEITDNLEITSSENEVSKTLELLDQGKEVGSTRPSLSEVTVAHKTDASEL